MQQHGLVALDVMWKLKSKRKVKQKNSGINLQALKVHIIQSDTLDATM